MNKRRPTRKDFLKMPFRKEEDTNRVYQDLFVVPAGTKHDSGYMHIAIIGHWVEDGKNHYEICSYSDDINWILPDSQMKGYTKAHLRTDCWYPEGVLRFWGRGTFAVDGLSSAEIVFVPDNK